MYQKSLLLSRTPPLPDFNQLNWALPARKLEQPGVHIGTKVALEPIQKDTGGF